MIAPVRKCTQGSLYSRNIDSNYILIYRMRNQSHPYSPNSLLPYSTHHHHSSLNYPNTLHHNHHLRCLLPKIMTIPNRQQTIPINPHKNTPSGAPSSPDNLSHSPNRSTNQSNTKRDNIHTTPKQKRSRSRQKCHPLSIRLTANPSSSNNLRMRSNGPTPKRPAKN